MPAMTNLLVKDDAAVEHTFLPVTDNPNPQWRDNVSGVAIDGQIRFQLLTEKLKNGTHRLVAKTEVPVMETLGASGTSAGYVAAQAVAYVLPVTTTMYAPPRSTLADRANALRLHIGCIQGATSVTATGTLANTAAAAAWANSSAPVTSFFTNLIQPN